MEELNQIVDKYSIGDKIDFLGKAMTVVETGKGYAYWFHFTIPYIQCCYFDHHSDLKILTIDKNSLKLIK